MTGLTTNKQPPPPEKNLNKSQGKFWGDGELKGTTEKYHPKENSSASRLGRKNPLPPLRNVHVPSSELVK